MKFALLFALSVLAPVSASAQIVHHSALNHEGRSITVRYEPRIATTLRQIGLGPRASAACMWRTAISVQRTALAADGRPIAALTRAVSGDKTRSGQQAGHCASLTPREHARFAGSEAALRAHVTAIADRDAESLRSELASLAPLGAGASHAR